MSLSSPPNKYCMILSAHILLLSTKHTMQEWHNKHLDTIQKMDKNLMQIFFQISNSLTTHLTIITLLYTN